MTDSQLFWLVIGLVFAKTAITLVLDLLNMKSVLANKHAIPEAYKSMIDEETYAKSVSYTLDKIKFSLVETLYSSLLLVAVLYFELFPKVFYAIEGAFGTNVFAQAVAIIFTFVVFSIFDLPFEYYSQFKLEEKHGFNKTTVKLWITDKVKGTLLGLLIGTPLLALILWFFGAFENTWWICCFVAIVAFQLLMVMIYPKLILPIFNKLEPLKDGSLKDRLFALSKKCDFQAQEIQVMDGSKRSAHSNAFFTGFGKYRRVIFYDTILEQLDENEIEGVLAHEIGHYKKKHIWAMMAMSFASMGIAFYLMSLLAKWDTFYSTFGFKPDSSFAPVLILFMLLSGLVTFWFGPIFTSFSRRNEYQADAYSKEICGTADGLISALHKLHTKNLGNLTPHPIYSAFYYSHPTLQERENSLKGKA